MKKVLIPFCIIAFFAVAFINYSSITLNSSQEFLMKIEGLTSIAKAQAESDYKSASKAVDTPIYETRSGTYYNGTCNCIMPYSYKVKVGSQLCCAPATVNDRCSAPC